MLEIAGVPIGSVAQLGTLGTMVVGLTMLWPKMRELHINKEIKQVEVYATECGTLRGEVSELRKDLRKCEEDCTESLNKVHEEIFGLRKDAIQQQISLINVIAQSVQDNPELSRMLNTLESVQVALKGNVLKDALENGRKNNDTQGT